MLNGLAPAGPVAPVVPAAPPSLSDTALPASREAFQDVYRSVPAEQDQASEQKPKQKSAESSNTRAKDAGNDEKNDKTAIISVPTTHIPVLLKAPLAFTIAAFGQQPDSQPASAEHSNSSDDAAPRAGGSDIKLELPKMGLPLIKEGAPLPIAQISRNEQIAFTARLTQADATPRETTGQRVPAPVPARDPGNKPVQIPETSRSSVAAAKEANPTDAMSALPHSETIAPVREAAAAAALDLRPATSAQPAEPAHSIAARPVAVQDVQAIMPEIPKPPATSEIFLHVAGADQSTASVRVVERAGTVNVSVHAADPDLRSSLRSNLGDLASQLSSQGFRTEVVRPTVIAANAENQHDSRHGNQGAAGQQQHPSAQDGRQPQRDRRSNSQDWLEQLERQTSGNTGTVGGKSQCK